MKKIYNFAENPDNIQKKTQKRVVKTLTQKPLFAISLDE